MAETYKPDILVKFGDEDIDDIGDFDYCYCWAMEGLQESGDEDYEKKAEKIEEHYEKVREAESKQSNMLQNKNNKEVSRPNIASKQPTYTAKAPKK